MLHKWAEDASACRRPCTSGLMSRMMSRMMSRGLITVSAYGSSYVRRVRGAGSRWGRLQRDSRLRLNVDEERHGTMDFNLIKNDRLWGWSTHNTMRYIRGLWRLSIENRLDSNQRFLEVLFDRTALGLLSHVYRRTRLVLTQTGQWLW